MHTHTENYFCQLKDTDVYAGGLLKTKPSAFEVESAAEESNYNSEYFDHILELIQAGC
jgi:hypothetical protein